MPALGPALRPNQWIPRNAYYLIAVGWAILVVAAWLLSPSIFPRPGRVIEEMGHLVNRQGLIGELSVSLGLFLTSLLIASVISLALAYSTVIPAMRPIIAALTKLRFLSLVGLSFIVTVMVGGGRPLKMTLLVFGISVFLLTSLVDVVASVPEERLDHARTLRMSEWRTVWEVIVLGQAHNALDAIRQNAAIGWAMLTMVEGIARGEGGIGTMLMDQNKHFNLAAIFAVQAIFLLVGLLQDTFLAWLKNTVAPYAALTTVKR
jgi:NitT/TauT family transport system permease protein